MRRFLYEVTPDRHDPLGRGVLTPNQLLRHFAAVSGLPDFVLLPEASRTPEALTEAFERHVLGQPEAIEAAVDAVAVLQQGLDAIEEHARHRELD